MSTEEKIVKRLIAKALDTGHSLSVWDGEAFSIRDSTDAKAIFDATRSTDEDRLLYFKDGKHVGWVQLVYGNDEDVIADNTLSVEHLTS